MLKDVICFSLLVLSVSSPFHVISTSTSTSIPKSLITSTVSHCSTTNDLLCYASRSFPALCLVILPALFSDPYLTFLYSSLPVGAPWTRLTARLV